MTATLEKVDNGFILETKDGKKRVGMHLNELLPTIYSMFEKEIIDCIMETGEMLWEFEIEINVKPTTRHQHSVEMNPCDRKEKEL